MQDFPGGPVVKNPPANAGCTGSTPGPGRVHLPQGKWACAPQQERPLQQEACTSQGEKAPMQQEDPAQPETKLIS